MPTLTDLAGVLGLSADEADYFRNWLDGERERAREAGRRETLSVLKSLSSLNGSTEAVVAFVRKAAGWDESKHKRDRGRFAHTEGGHDDAVSGEVSGDRGAGATARAEPGVASGAAAVPEDPDEKARTLAERIKEVPAAVASRVSEWLAEKYQKLSARYGPTGAKAVLGAMIVLTPTPIPGSSLIPIALAEAVLRVRRAITGVQKSAPPLSDEHARALARDLLHDLYESEGETLPTERKHKYASTHVELTGEVAERLRALAASVPDADLADDGREEEPHVTVRYGLHGDDPAEVAPLLTGAGPVTLHLGKVTVFPGAEKGKDYDVLKVDVESPDLVRLHEKLGALPHTDTHADYHPHATIAYVKAGLGEKYAAEMGGIDADATADEVVFSDRDHRHTRIPLADPGAQPDHSQALLAALVESVSEAVESGDDPEAAAESFRPYIDDPQLLAGVAEGSVTKATWDSAKHPRDDHGRFVSREAIHAAKSDPKKAEELRQRVTDPEERKKLDAALAGESDTGRTQRGQARETAAARRREKAATKARADELIRKISAGQLQPLTHPITADDLHALADHLPEMTVADLRRARMALHASFGGDRRKLEMVERLKAHAKGWAEEVRPTKRLAPAKKRRPRAAVDTVLEQVILSGGIDPESHDLLTSYESMRRAVQDGIPIAAFKKGGQGLDALAQELENDGYIKVPENRHGGEYVLDLLKARAHTLHADLSKEYERAQLEYERAREEAAADHPAAEVAEALRSGEDAGRREAADDPLGERGEGAGESHAQVATPADYDPDVFDLDKPVKFGVVRDAVDREIAAARERATAQSPVPEPPPATSSPAAPEAAASDSAPVPAVPAEAAQDTHEAIDGTLHPTRAAAEAVARGVEGGAVTRLGDEWMAVKPAPDRGTPAPSRPPTTPAPTTPEAAGTPGGVSGLSDREFARKVQAAADHPEATSYAGHKTFIHDVYRRLAAEDPSLTREDFDRRLLAANAAGHLDLSRADLVQTMHPDDVRASEVKHPLGVGEFHFVRRTTEGGKPHRGPKSAEEARADFATWTEEYAAGERAKREQFERTVYGEVRPAATAAAGETPASAPTKPAPPAAAPPAGAPGPRRRKKRTSLFADQQPPAEPTHTAKLADGRTVGFVPHEVASGKHAADYATVEVDPEKLDAAWAKDAGYYIPPGGGGAEIGGRRKDFQEFLASGEPVRAPYAVANGERVSFEDGRHRFSVLRDAGIDRIPVTVPRSQAADFAERFGAGDG